MNSWILPLAVMAVLVLATAVLSLAAMLRAGLALKAATEMNEEGWRNAKARMDQLEARIEELGVQATTVVAEPVPTVRPAMNLSKRSQALRMHRRGDPPEAIAAALSIPFQEVDLLIKVHRIVLATL